MNKQTKAPDFWKVKVSDIQKSIESLKVGTSKTLCHSPGKHPVTAIFYGDQQSSHSTTNLSGAMGANIPSSYKKQSKKQTIMIVAGCHGAEAEGVAGTMNLIKLLEDKKDYLNKKREQLLEQLMNYHLIIIPCLNPDGRARSPDFLQGVNPEEALKINQGVWKNGQPIGYPTCKEYQPLNPDDVEFLGGYPNDSGFNLMHDATPGNIETEEVRALLKLCHETKPDLVLHLHSHPLGAEILPPTHGMFDYHKHQLLKFRNLMVQKFKEKNLSISHRVLSESDGAHEWCCPFNLTTLTSHVCGALSPTFEQTNGTGPHKLSFEDMIEETMTIVELFVEQGLTNALNPLEQVFSTMADMTLGLKNKINA